MTSRWAPGAASATRRVDQLCEIPWNPYTRIRRRHLSGIAYVLAAGGMVAWNAVSKTAYCATPGNRSLHSWIASSAGGWCSGASSPNACSSSRRRSSMRAGVSCSPPCTTRWITTSKSPERSSAWSSDASGIVAPEGSANESFSDVEPALTTSARTASSFPRPLDDVSDVLAVLARPLPGPQARVDKMLTQRRSPGSETGNAVDHVDGEAVAVEVVEHHHVERRRRGAVLLEAVDVETGVVASLVREPVHEPRIAVEGEDHGPVLGEEVVELARRKTVRMLVVGEQPHEVDDVHDAHVQVGERPPQDRRRRQRLERGDVAGAREHHVRLLAVDLGAGPLPDADAPRAVRERIVGREPVHARLLPGDDDVHEVARPEAAVERRQQRVG